MKLVASVSGCDKDRPSVALWEVKIKRNAFVVSIINNQEPLVIEVGEPVQGRVFVLVDIRSLRNSTQCLLDSIRGAGIYPEDSPKAVKSCVNAYTRSQGSLQKWKY